MSGLVFRSAARSHVGHVRTLNEDSFLDRPELGLWAIADGMGGHELGDRASRLITARLGELPPAPDAPTLARMVQAALGQCHEELQRFGGPDRVCGSTVVVLLVFEEHFAGLWAGDSRLYRLRDGRLELLSRDHSLVQELVERGELAPEAARRHPLRSRITRAIGVGDRLEVDVVQDRLVAGDLFLLCSDGLTGELEDAEIEAVLRTAGLEAAAEELVARTLAREARDNLSLILVGCEAAGQELASTLPRGRPQQGGKRAMELINATRMQAAYTMGIEPSAREHLVVAIKGTFAFPERDGDACTLADEQAPLIMADEFFGAPGYSSPRYEVDFALTKPRCDILLNATAYAPGGRPSPRVPVGVKIDGWSKVFDVVGDRVWLQRGATLGPSAPEPFVTKPITYEHAFGGVDNLDPDEEPPDSYVANPVGRGWHRVRNQSRIPGTPLPATEDPADPVSLPWGDYRPMGFGVRGRNWVPRYRYAGTYDQDWIDNVFPFLPADFDVRYYQAAPEDRQIDHPKGGEEVILANLTPQGRTRFRLPQIDVPVVFFRKRGGHEQKPAVLDTILIEPDRRRALLTWRASLPLKRNMFEIVQVVVGQMSRAWWRARQLGKIYYPSLDTMVRERRAEAEEA